MGPEAEKIYGKDIKERKQEEEEEKKAMTEKDTMQVPDEPLPTSTEPVAKDNAFLSTGDLYDSAKGVELDRPAMPKVSVPVMVAPVQMTRLE